MHGSLVGSSRQAAFFRPTVANGALQTLLDLVLGPVQSLMTRICHRVADFAVTHKTRPPMW